VFCLDKNEKIDKDSTSPFYQENRMPDENQASRAADTLTQIEKMRELLKDDEVFAAWAGQGNELVDLLRIATKGLRDPDEIFARWEHLTQDGSRLLSLVSQLHQDGHWKALRELYRKLSDRHFLFSGEVLPEDQTVTLTIVMPEPEKTLLLLEWLMRYTSDPSDLLFHTPSHVEWLNELRGDTSEKRMEEFGCSATEQMMFYLYGISIDDQKAHPIDNQEKYTTEQNPTTKTGVCEHVGDHDCAAAERLIKAYPSIHLAGEISPLDRYDIGRILSTAHIMDVMLDLPPISGTPLGLLPRPRYTSRESLNFWHHGHDLRFSDRWFRPGAVAFISEATREEVLSEYSPETINRLGVWEIRVPARLWKQAHPESTLKDPRFSFWFSPEEDHRRRQQHLPSTTSTDLSSGFGLEWNTGRPSFPRELDRRQQLSFCLHS
jgi:hypothetical protein